MANTVGLAQSVQKLDTNTRVITFNLKSQHALIGLLLAHRREVHQVVDVAKWALETFPNSRLVLLGSSAGAPIAGSALARLSSDHPYIAIGFTFGALAALGFGRHFSAISRSCSPKLFIQGQRDEFTSPTTLQKRVDRVAGPVNDMHIVPDVGHFELESSMYDELVAHLVVDWLDKIRSTSR